MVRLLLALSLMGLALPRSAPGGEGKDYPAPAPLADDPALGVGIQRTMKLLATSTPQRRHRVKILFYGQSITRGEWWEHVAADLRRRFPDADLTIENRAIGGFAAQALVLAAEQDLYPFYPDLVIFHVYGDHRRYEDIIRRLRERTTAEVAIWNDHVTWLPTGGEPDQDRTKGYEWNEWFSYEFLPGLARRYGCCLMDVRTEWKRYLQDNGLQPRDLLKDDVHLNEQGNWLLAELVKRRLVYRADLPDVSQRAAVRTYQVGRDVQWRDGRLWFEFEGNRVDAISAREPGTDPSKAQVLIDGVQPSQIPELYAFTRPTNAFGVWYPAVMRVGWRSLRLVEDWKAVITDVDEETGAFSFEVTGSVTGPDGAGMGDKAFVSNSGRVVIEPSDWSVERARKWSGKAMPVGFEVKWSAVPLHVDVYEPPPVEDPSREYATTLAQGLGNARHVLELRADGGKPSPIRAIRVYEPSVR